MISFIIKININGSLCDVVLFDESVFDVFRLVLWVFGSINDFVFIIWDVVCEVIFIFVLVGNMFIVDVFYEVVLYFCGNNVFYGKLWGDFGVNSSIWKYF